jgi:hypothetical protein
MSDFTDDRRGAYDPISKDGLQQPRQVRERTPPHQKQQRAADV